MKQAFVLITLIDITKTDIVRGDSKQRDQQRNWETVLQVLSLKTQPNVLEGPLKIEYIDLASYNGFKLYFGDFYHDMPAPHTLWAVKFNSEHSEIYDIESLYQDFDQVPIILGLDETARFMLPIFHSYGTLKNIHLFRAEELNIY